MAAGVAFVIRQRRAANPLYDLHVAARRIFWVAAVAGIIVFGSLMGAMFIGQQFLQNVLGYSTLEAGRRSCRRPCAWCWSRRGRPSWSRPAAPASRCCSATSFVLLGFLTMLLLWKEDISYWQVGLGYAFVGDRCRLRRHARVALADRFGPGDARGMASGTADLQRDLGGAIMQSIFGALLTAGLRVGASPPRSRVVRAARSPTAPRAS